MSQIKKFSFSSETIDKLKSTSQGENWPVVYILENSSEAYIGETTNLARRTKQHLENPERQVLKNLYMIADSDFNKSATLDIESLLIEHISADGKYLLQNGNGGLQNHNYYDKEKYYEKFEHIWSALRSHNITKHSIFEIRNSDIFKFSPYKALSSDQLEVVMTIDQLISSHSESLSIVRGEPGSGKTVLATYLAKFFANHEHMPLQDVGVVLPMTSIRSTVKNVFKHVKGLKRSMVMGPSEVVKIGRKYDLLIVDEAHRLAQRKNLSSYSFFDETNRKLGLDPNEATQLDWILNSARHVILFYDQNQSVKPSDVDQGQFDKLMSRPGCLQLGLKSQMRLNGGIEYVQYVSDLLNQNLQTQVKFDHYDFKLFSDVDDMIQAIKQKDKEHGLCRNVAGYAWKWLSKNDQTLYDINIGSYRYRWNSVNADWINSKNALEEIGCIHTVQGYDLNYAGVIIGPELVMKNGKIEFVSGNYKDSYGKHKSKSKDEMLKYITNIYKTLMTRGIMGTYVYVCDDALREYFGQLVERSAIRK